MVGLSQVFVRESGIDFNGGTHTHRKPGIAKIPVLESGNDYVLSNIRDSPRLIHQCPDTNQVLLKLLSFGLLYWLTSCTGLAIEYPEPVKSKLRCQTTAHSNSVFPGSNYAHRIQGIRVFVVSISHMDPVIEFPL